MSSDWVLGIIRDMKKGYEERRGVRSVTIPSDMDEHIKPKKRGRKKRTEAEVDAEIETMEREILSMLKEMTV